MKDKFIVIFSVGSILLMILVAICHGFDSRTTKTFTAKVVWSTATTSTGATASTDVPLEVIDGGVKIVNPSPVKLHVQTKATRQSDGSVLYETIEGK